MRTIVSKSINFNVELKEKFWNYVPLSQHNIIKQLKNSEEVFLMQFTDAIYFGQIFRNMRHVLGIMVYNNGRIYEGSWQLDRRDGHGFERYPNGNQYE